MKKEYQKPDLEYVKLVACEAIANELIDPSMGDEDAWEDWD